MLASGPDARPAYCTRLRAGRRCRFYTVDMAVQRDRLSWVFDVSATGTLPSKSRSGKHQNQEYPVNRSLDARRAPEEAASFYLDVSVAELDAAPRTVQMGWSLHLMRPSRFNSPHDPALCVLRNRHRGEQRCGGVAIWRSRTWRKKGVVGGMWNVAVKARPRCCPQRLRGAALEAQCPVIPAIEASVQRSVALAVIARAQKSGELQRRAARPTQTDRANDRTATEQRDDGIPRPASSIHGPVRPSIHPMPASWPRGLRVPFQQGARSPRLGFWLHLLCCSKPPGQSTRGLAAEPGTHQQEGAILAILLSPSPVAPPALSTCSYGWPRAGEQNKNNSCQLSSP